MACSYTCVRMHACVHFFRYQETTWRAGSLLLSHRSLEELRPSDLAARPYLSHCASLEASFVCGVAPSSLSRSVDFASF